MRTRSNPKSRPSAPPHISVAGLFVGCGGLDYGFKKAGFDLTWANEWEPDAAASYRSLVGHDVIVDDIWSVLHKIPKVDVIVGGPPCQSFSLVGKRLEQDPRGRLVFAFERAVARIRPKAFLMENVPGLTASRIDGERLHIHLARRFARIGYKVEIMKLVATDFFVPQRRQRVLMIGHRVKTDWRLLSSGEFSKTLGESRLNRPVSVSEALDDLPSPSLDKSRLVSYAKAPHSAYSKLMRRSSNGKVALQVFPTMSRLDREFVKHIPPGGNYMDIPDSLATKRVMSFKASGGRTTTYGRLHPDRPAYTINTYFNRPNVGANYHHRERRLITVREALRLQSFPDHFTPAFRSQRSLHMQVGNAVPPLMGWALAESIKRLFL